MSNGEVLKQYYDFAEPVVQAVEQAAEMQNKYDFTELTYKYGIDDGPQIVLPEGSQHPVEIITFQPSCDYNVTQARILHAPMGNALGPNMAIRAMRLFGADPRQQLIVVGNPSSPRHGNGKVSIAEAMQVVRTGSLRPFVDPLLRYLAKEGITSASHLGYSYGAEKAIASTQYAPNYDVRTHRTVGVEPASVIARKLFDLATAFASSNGQLATYIKQSDSMPYTKIREQDTLLGLMGYCAGLLRLSNIAVAHTLARGELEKNVQAALAADNTVKIMIGWGSQSELSPDRPMRDMVSRLQSGLHGRHLKAMCLNGMHHAGADDINLHAAIMLQGLRN